MSTDTRSPDKSVTKDEKIDLDMAQWISSTQDIASEEKRRITQMLKNKTKGNIVTVTYVLGKQMKSEYVGRWMAKGSIGLQGLSRDVRNALARPYYWDVDIKNCQVEILRQMAIKKEWPHEALDKYCQNRDAIFADIQKTHDLSRDDIKQKFIRILFGGHRNINDPPWINNVFWPEVHTLIEKICLTDPALLAKCSKKKSDNAQGSCAAIILQTEERKCLEALECSLAKNDRSLDVYIHDGGYVRKLDGERSFPQEILKKASEDIEKDTGYKLELCTKEVETTFVMPAKQELDPNKSYKAIKEDFEKNNFKCAIETCFYQLVKDGLYIRRRKNDLITMFENIFYQVIDKKTGKVVEEPFIYNWLKDPSMRTYTKVEVLPPPLHCPEDTYNLWSGFEIEKHELKDVTEKDREDVQRVHGHLKKICNEDQSVYDYLINWLAHAYQQPGLKPNTAILILSSPGLGKEIGLHQLQEALAGPNKAMITQDYERDILGNFNPMIENKLFIILDEMTFKSAVSNSSKMKEMITRKDDTINQKGLPVRKVPSFFRIISFADRDFPWMIDEKDRRYVAIDSSEQAVPGQDYFDALGEALKNKNAMRLLFDELKSVDLSKWKPKESRPQTAFMKDLKQISRPLETQFIISYIEDMKSYSKEVEIPAKELMGYFREWLHDQGMSDIKTTSIKFGIHLRNLKIDGFDRKRTRTGAVYTFDVKPAKAWLVKNDYADPEVEPGNPEDSNSKEEKEDLD